jgi:hypothetical protein
MTTFTSTLPDDLLLLLAQKAKELGLPKNKLLENALRIYLDQLNRAAYVASYKEAGTDISLMTVAEEGMADYMAQLPDETR